MGFSFRSPLSSSLHTLLFLRSLALLLLIVSVATPASEAARIFVTTTKDKISNFGGCSLKEAIYSSVLHTSLDGIHGSAIAFVDSQGFDAFIITECMAGTGNDIIVLPSFGVYQMSSITIDAHNPFGPTATPIIFSNITIEANGSTLQWVGTKNSRAFAVGTGSITIPGVGTVSGSGNLTIKNAYIKNFSAKGGDGGSSAVQFGPSGGGGLGAGGAIYVDGTNGIFGKGLTVENCTFEGNGAFGGNGGSDFQFASLFIPGGGGGGLSGNGGGLALQSDGGGGGGGARGTGGRGGGGFGSGGGGGGTVADGTVGGAGNERIGGAGGLTCGGNGGNNGDDGNDASCQGGGGGGGGGFNGDANLGTGSGPGHGGNGNYGGGGGGGGSEDNFSAADGGNGGFGGGGGGGGTGGNGGYGGGGGDGLSAGAGGTFAGHGGTFVGGGGGAALGGAIFSHFGGVTIRNSTFTNNFVDRGVGGSTCPGCRGTPASGGSDAGGAIFAVDGELTVVDSTISGNQSTGSGGGIVVDRSVSELVTLFTLKNTIIFNNGAMDQNGILTNALNECSLLGGASIDSSSVGNLIQNNDNCIGVVSSADPQLGPLQINQLGVTPTMAIPITSPAYNTADPNTSLATDQRGVDRPQVGLPDIGAFELCVSRDPSRPPCDRFVILPPPDTALLTIQLSPAAGGTTNPVAGTHSELLDSVVALTAMPNLGYGFVNWTGAVADPSNPSTAVIMDQPQTVTANFAPLPTSMAGNIIAKTGLQKARVWTLSLLNNGPGVANGVTIHSFTLTQTFGAACTPIVSPFPMSLGNLAPGQTATTNVTLNFTGCAARARFTAKFIFSANSGAVSGVVVRGNQFQ